jgi:hypothetical protein
MNVKRFWLNYVYVPPLALAGSGFLLLASCVPMARIPTLNEVRTGSAQGAVTESSSLSPGEVPAEVVEIDNRRQELRVLTDDNRRFTLTYDANTQVTFHGAEYRADDLEAGDRIAFRTAPRDSRYVETIRIQEPVQARAGRGGIARTAPPLPRRNDIVEGTVERINYDLGVFDVRPRSGRPVTVSVPYNARAADVENFRSLRRGDHVRVEGEFVNPESFQLLAFVSPR